MTCCSPGACVGIRGSQHWYAQVLVDSIGMHKCWLTVLVCTSAAALHVDLRAEYISGGLSELICSSVAVLQRAPQMPEHAYPGLNTTGYLHCSVGIGMRLSQSKEICVDPVCGH